MTRDPWTLIVMCIAATYLWRALGTMLATRIEPDSAVFLWISCTSYALLAALVARMIIFPLGELADTPWVDRVAAAAIAIAIFQVFGRRTLASVATGFCVFVALAVVRT